MGKSTTSLRHVLNGVRRTANARSRGDNRPAAVQKILAVLLCMLLPSYALGAVLPNGSYLVQMSDSAMAVVSSGATPRERVSIRQDTVQGVWHFEHLGNDYYRVNARLRGMVLDSSESKKYNGVPIIIFPWHGGKNQRWKLIGKGPFFAFINQETGLALDLKGNVQKTGNVFQGYTPNDSRGQLFRLTPVDQIKKQEEQKRKTPQESQEDQNIKEFSNSPHPDAL